jgi:hypothetical protein
MRNPSFKVILVEKVQVRANHVGQSLCALCVAHGRGEKSDVIVAEDIVPTGFMEVFILGGSI